MTVVQTRPPCLSGMFCLGMKKVRPKLKCRGIIIADFKGFTIFFTWPEFKLNI